MLDYYCIIYCTKQFWFHILFTYFFLYAVSGARIYRDTKDRRHPELKLFDDMKVLAISEESPELPRKDLIRLIEKSQFFQDIFQEQPEPMMIQFGHVCENPTEWEQRFEQRDFNKNHYRGKIRWGNKNGDYGEQYWGLGHAGR